MSAGTTTTTTTTTLEVNAVVSTTKANRRSRRRLFFLPTRSRRRRVLKSAVLDDDETCFGTFGKSAFVMMKMPSSSSSSSSSKKKKKKGRRRGSSMRSRAFEMHDDPDEYSLDEESDDDDDDLGELDGVEEKELEKVLKAVAEKEIMLKKLTNDMVKQFLRNDDDDDVNAEKSETEDEARRSREEENEAREEEDEEEEKKIETKREDGSIAFDSIDDEKRDELLKDIWLPKRASMRGSVKLFLDSADESEWRKWLSTGLFFGVTMNVQLLEKSEKLATANDEDFSFQTLLGLVDAALEYDGVNEVHVPSWGLDSDEIWKNGIVLAKNDPQRIVVAVPCTYDGIKAANALVTDGARVQISGVFAPHQALLAAAIGASYVAPTFGKMYDAGRDGFKGTEEMMKTITKCGSESKVLVKNVRSAVDVANLGSIGCDTFAISAEVCEDMFSDSLTTQYDKELNFTVARIGEKQRELKIEAQKQKLLEMEKQSMPVQDDPESEGGENDPESVGAATRRASATIATPMATPSPSQPSDGGVSKPKPKSNNIISLEEMPKNVFVENDFDDVDASSSDGSSPDAPIVIDSDDFNRKDVDP